MIATTSCRTAISAQGLPPRMWRWSTRCVSNLHDKNGFLSKIILIQFIVACFINYCCHLPTGQLLCQPDYLHSAVSVTEKKLQIPHPTFFPVLSTSVYHQVGLCNPEKQHGKEHWVGSPCDQGGEWHCLCWQHVWFHLAFPPGKLTIAGLHNDSGHSWKMSPSCCPNPGHIEQFETKIGWKGIDLCEGQIPLIKSSLSSDCW